MIRGFQFFNQRQGKIVHLLLLGSTLFGRGEKGTDTLSIQVWNRLCRQVTHHHGCSRIGCLELLHLGIDQRRRIAVITEYTAFNNQNVHVCHSL